MYVALFWSHGTETSPHRSSLTQSEADVVQGPWRTDSRHAEELDGTAEVLVQEPTLGETNRPPAWEVTESPCFYAVHRLHHVDCCVRIGLPGLQTDINVPNIDCFKRSCLLHCCCLIRFNASQYDWNCFVEGGMQLLTLYILFNSPV